MAGSTVRTEKALVRQIVSVFPAPEKHGTGSVTEKDADSSVLKIGHLGETLRRYDQDILHIGGLQVSHRYVEGLDESGTGSIDVKAKGIWRAELRLNDAGHIRGDIIRCHGGNDDHVNLIRGNIGHLQRLAGSLNAHLPGRFSRAQMSFLYSRPGSNPVVTRFDDLGEPLVFDDQFRQIRAGTENFICLSHFILLCKERMLSLSVIG